MVLEKFTERIWMETPKFADFSKSEYDRRNERAAELMSEEDIDLLVIWDNDNLRYFTGFVCTLWDCKSLQSAVYLLPVDEEPWLIVPSLFRTKAEGCTYVKNLLVQETPHNYKEMREFPRDVGEAIKKMGYGGKRIGVEAGLLGGMVIPRPLNDIELFKKVMGKAQFVESANLIWKCRIIKSEAEIAAVKQASSIQMAAYREMLDNYELGWTKRDVGNFIEAKSIAMKGESFKSASMSVTRDNLMADWPHYYDIPIDKGDRICVEFGVRYKGYRGGLARNLQVGPPTGEQEKIDDTIKRCQEIAADVVEPGLKASEVIRAVNKELRKQRLQERDMVGHGIGLTPHEPPMLEATGEMVLDEGMTLAIEVWQSTRDHGKFGCEDVFVVTKDGCEPLAPPPYYLDPVRCVLC